MSGVYITTLIICLLALIFNRRNVLKIFPSFLILLAIVLLVEVVERQSHEIFGDITYLFYSMLELSLMGTAYHSIFQSKIIKTNIRRCILIAWVVFAFGIMVFGIEAGEFLSILLSHAFIATLAMIYFYKAFVAPYNGLRILRDAFFWINCANLFFYVGAFLMMSLDRGDYTLHEQWTLHYISTFFNFALYIIYAISFTFLKIKDNPLA